MFVKFTWVLNITQKAFVLCRLFNNEEKSNKGGPAKSKPALSPVSPVLEVQAAISDQMMSDISELVQCNNDNKHHKAYVPDDQAEGVRYIYIYIYLVGIEKYIKLIKYLSCALMFLLSG